MPAPEFLTHATEGWARFYGTHKTVATGIMFVHLSGLLLGGGAAVAADRETLKAAGEAGPVRADHLAFLGSVHAIAVAGIVMLAVSGALMLVSDLDNFWEMRSFWIKMSLVGLLLANALVMQRAERLASVTPAAAWAQLKATSIISLGLWFAIVLASTVMASS
ncbi:MAG: hypothetical protein NTY02_14125 [Acidobacteria bacterium]|nr:hypothetical protein [Acidobacteriota bacterium]